MAGENWALDLITTLHIALADINTIKGRQPAVADGRCLSIAATHLETAMLWVANARQEG